MQQAKKTTAQPAHTGDQTLSSFGNFVTKLSEIATQHGRSKMNKVYFDSLLQEVKDMIVEYEKMQQDQAVMPDPNLVQTQFDKIFKACPPLLKPWDKSMNSRAKGAETMNMKNLDEGVSLTDSPVAACSDGLNKARGCN